MRMACRGQAALQAPQRIHSAESGVFNLHSAAFQLAAQIVMKVIHASKFSCYNRLDYKGIPASVPDAPTRLLIDVQVRLST